MQTAMSVALAKVGLVTEEQASNVDCVPCHLKPYEQQIEEISRLAGLLKTNGVKESGMYTVNFLAFKMDLAVGRHAEAYSSMLKYLSQRVSELSL